MQKINVLTGEDKKGYYRLHITVCSHHNDFGLNNVNAVESCCDPITQSG